MSVYDHIDDTNMNISFVCMCDHIICFFLSVCLSVVVFCCLFIQRVFVLLLLLLVVRESSIFPKRNWKRFSSFISGIGIELNTYFFGLVITSGYIASTRTVFNHFIRMATKLKTTTNQIKSKNKTKTTQLKI